jgi:hypothetical protein
MQFVVEEALSGRDIHAARYLEDRVFRKEKGISLPPLEETAEGVAFRLLARHASTGQPAGTLSVVEANAPDQMNHARRMARYTRLAVLPECRGRSLSMRLILEGQRLFVARENIRHSWLLFDASRASTSLLCNLLGFHCGQAVIRSEYGPCRILSRDELSFAAQDGNRRGWAYLSALGVAGGIPEESLFPYPISASMGGEAIALPHAA